MKCLALAFLALVGLSTPAMAQSEPVLGSGVFEGGAVGHGGCEGPGDVVANAKAWYGLRAYSNAQCSGTAKAVNLTRLSDSTACDFDIAVTGDFGTSDSGCSLGGGLTASAFATQDATATCTISTTTATCTGASSTPHQYSTITGAGLTQPCWAASVGTFTGGAGAVTLGGTGTSPCGTVGVGETLTFTYGLTVSTLYDQSGALSCTGSTTCAMNQNGSGVTVKLLPSCLNAKPCIYFGGGQYLTTTSLSALSGTTYRSFNMVLATLTSASNPAPYTNVDNSNTNLTGFVIFHLAAHTIVADAFNNASGSGTATSATLANGVWGVPGGIFASAISRTSYLDAVAATTDTGSITVAATNEISMGGYHKNGGNFNMLTGYMTEAGQWGVLSGANMTSLCHNDYVYWGTATSC